MPGYNHSILNHSRIAFILLMGVQTGFMVLRTVTEMQNDVGMTSQIGYFRFISLFGNYSTKIYYKFDENTSVSKKWSKTL